MPERGADPRRRPEVAEVEGEEGERGLHHDQLLHQLSEIGLQYDAGEEELPRVETGAQFNTPLVTTVLMGYYDYLGTWPKSSHRPIIVTGE